MLSYFHEYLSSQSKFLFFMKKRFTITTSYQLKVEIKEKAVNAFNFLSDLHNHVDLHPLLTKVSIMKTFHNEEGQEITVYKIDERIKVFRFFYMSNSYVVNRTVLKDQNKFVFEVKTFPNIHLSSTYTFLETETNETQLEESVVMKSPLGLSGFVTKTARDAHEISLAKLKEYLEQKNEAIM